jgi:hypothetical protein
MNLVFYLSVSSNKRMHRSVPPEAVSLRLATSGPREVNMAVI